MTGRMKVKEIQEEKVPNSHLGKSKSEWSRAVLKLFGLRTPLYSSTIMSENPQQLLLMGVLSINM